MQVSARQIADVLGGARTLGAEVRDLSDLGELVNSGLPFGVLEQLEQVISASGNTSVRSIVRARRAAGKMGMVVSAGERAERLARIFAMAESVFGNSGLARDFLLTHHHRLGNRTPLECLRTEIGGREVEDILDSIAFGLPA